MSTYATDRKPFSPSGPYGQIIGGDEAPGDASFDAVEPSTGAIWAQLAQGTAADVDRAVATARRAFTSWRRTTPAVRQELLWRMADAVEAEPERWATLLATENGRPIREATIADVPTCAAILRYFASVVRGLHGSQIPVERPGSLVYTTREPLGVIAALIPWNSPIITLANKIGPALATGNTVVVKPSEFATPSIVEFARAVQGILPPGVLNVVTGTGPETGAALVSHPDVAKVTFTGGTETARHIMSAAGRVLTPAIMELGGKGAMIVFPDADLESAVSDALAGIFMGNGQVCVAASRLLVHRDVHDEFRERFTAVASTIRVGDALDPSTEFGPLVSAAQRDRVVACVDRATSEGASVELGGGALTLEGELAGGFYVRPTLLSDPAGSTSASREEVFGPVTVLETFTDEDDALARANEGRYGLATGVWTRDLARAHRTAAELDSGIVWINKWFDLAVGAPMGGVGDSGFGRETSAETLLEYVQDKTVNVDLGAPRPPLWGLQDGAAE